MEYRVGENRTLNFLGACLRKFRKLDKLYLGHNSPHYSRNGHKLSHLPLSTPTKVTPKPQDCEWVPSKTSSGFSCSKLMSWERLVYTSEQLAKILHIDVFALQAGNLTKVFNMGLTSEDYPVLSFSPNFLFFCLDPQSFLVWNFGQKKRPLTSKQREEKKWVSSQSLTLAPLSLQLPGSWWTTAHFPPACHW